METLNTMKRSKSRPNPCRDYDYNIYYIYAKKQVEERLKKEKASNQGLAESSVADLTIDIDCSIIASLMLMNEQPIEEDYEITFDI